MLSAHEQFINKKGDMTRTTLLPNISGSNTHKSSGFFNGDKRDGSVPIVQRQEPKTPEYFMIVW